jgi:capsular exopolysaccharide synthesis family protein
MEVLMPKIAFEKRKELDYRMNEAYKSLRTNILFCGDNVKVITLTSCMPNEGKTTVAFELAHSMANNGYKTILIDADLRKSVLVGRYKVGVVKEGLSHYLTGQCPLENVICETDIENMNVIFSGPYAPNPTEILSGKYFQDMLDTLRLEYDYVIIDAPPLGSVIDAAIISKISDGAVMVVSVGEISYRFAQSVKAQLEKSNCKILGAVLNKVPIGGSGSYYGKYYGKYYGRHYGKYYGSYGEYGKQEDND